MPLEREESYQLRGFGGNGKRRFLRERSQSPAQVALAQASPISSRQHSPRSSARSHEVRDSLTVRPQFHTYDEVPDVEYRRWLELQSRPIDRETATREQLVEAYKASPMPITANHHYSVAEDRYENQCAVCKQLIAPNQQHLQCSRCAVLTHHKCGYSLHPSSRPLVKNEDFRYNCIRRICGTEGVATFNTSSKSCDVFGFYHGQRVASLRGTFAGRKGTVVGVGQDLKLYVHWDGSSGCQALFAGDPGVQDAEQLQRCHMLYVDGCCTPQGLRDSISDDTIVNSVDELVAANFGFNVDDWRENAGRKCCPRCQQPFASYTKCDECRLIVFGGAEYDEDEWGVLLDSPEYQVHLASHDGARDTIHGACEMGELEDINLLVQQHGMPVDALLPPMLYSWREDLQRTPLHVTVLSQLKLPGWYKSQGVRLAHEKLQVDIIRRLIELGAELDKRDATGRTALHLAAEFLSPYPVAADEDTYLNRQRSFRARMHADRDRKGADSTQRWPDGVRVLHELVALGADPSLKTADGSTPLDLLQPVLVAYPKFTQTRLSKLVTKRSMLDPNLRYTARATMYDASECTEEQVYSGPSPDTLHVQHRHSKVPQGSAPLCLRPRNTAVSVVPSAARRKSRRAEATWS